ncbi:uncharacterized protein PV06_11461 [Exophiala oligosperma]|uniref:Histone chaperone domain-containing protein n=2 Tax=Chaetothyriales TaxID=34395 RepID=A0A0D2CZ10_9EURO|nr:uncharacterized protein PV06_11461 [Exophiala oligosperma]KAJ9616181.1 hypothetical protein H2204_014025 [Knufia peltigerae]KIW36278.1 hypothetical protein PV06_11461 [Exophiala oligosperma]
MATNANQEFSKQDTTTDDIPQGGDTVDNSYASRPGQISIPVLRDETPVEQPNDAHNPDSDQALRQDEAEAIDKHKILKGGRTRNATKPKGTYQDPEGEADLPENDETSAVR